MYNFKRLKYKYYLKTSSNNINKIRELKVYKLRIDEEYIYFYTDDISTINTSIRYEILNDRDSELRRIFRNYTGLLLGLVLAVFVLFFNSFRYNEIIFNEKVNNEENIVEYIEEKTNSFLNIKYLNEDIIDINVDIRNKFPNLEWISIEKIGTDIYVSTVRQNIPEKSISDDAIGHLVSSTDAIIRLVNVKTGRLLVLQNQYVSSGDILVSSNLNEIYEGQEPYYVKSTGIVLGEYEETIEYKIPIEDKINKPTGKIDSYFNINILGFNLNFGRDNKYEKYKTVKDKQFSILGLISVNRVQDIEKSDIIVKNTKETAIMQIEDLVYSNFETTRVHEDEIVKNITINKVVEEGNFYKVSVFVHQIKNIAVFSEFIPEESDD